MRRFALGTFPAMGVSEARTEARALHTKVKRDGADPTAEARRERAISANARAGVGTMAAVLELYAEKRGSAQKSWFQARKQIEALFRPLLQKPAESLTASDFQMLADQHPAASTASLAVRSVRPVLKWASAHGRRYLAADVARIAPPAPVRRRTRVLDRGELARLLPTLRASDRPYAAAMLFMLLTLTRRQEAALAHWQDVDLERGSWKLRSTKNDAPHTVPLPRQAIALLRARLPISDDGNPGQPFPDGLIFCTSTGAELGNWDRETKVIQAASGTDNWHRHDLRRTSATLLGELGVLPDIIEAALNHAAIHSPIAATYNRARYRPQVAAALQHLADALDGIEAGAGDVVSIRSVGAP